MHQPTVLIITEQAEFSRLITARWQTERNPPAIAVVGPDICHQLAAGSFEFAILGGVAGDQLAATAALAQLNSPFLYIAETAEIAASVREVHPRALVLQRQEGWIEAAVLLVGEALRRGEAVDRAKRAEEANAALDRQAVLGRYMLEMRHTMNNALTSVLGNAELLLLEPGCLSADARSQVEIIRNMALRMNEILRRFTSLEKEFSALERANRAPEVENIHAAGAAS